MDIAIVWRTTPCRWTRRYNAPVEFAVVHGYRPQVPRITSQHRCFRWLIKVDALPDRWQYLPNH